MYNPEIKLREERCDQLRNLVRQEHETETQILELMKFIYEKNWYREKGYSSMYLFLIEDSGMPSSTAQRRVDALRLIEKVPEVAEMMKSGSLSLSNAAEIQKAVQSEKKLGHELKPEEIKEVAREVQNKSYRECQKSLAQALPLQAEAKVYRAKLTPTPEGKIQLVMNITPELEAKLNELKSLLSHQDPNPAPEKLIELIADQALQKLRKNKPNQKQKSAKEETSEEVVLAHEASAKSNITVRELPTSEAAAQKIEEQESAPEFSKRSRHIPAPRGRDVWSENEGRCAYVDSVTGKRCNSTHQLEIEHVVPFALGGTHDFENLTLLCRSHNQHQAWKQGLRHRRPNEH